MILCLFVLSEVDMRVCSEVWAVLNSRLEELLKFLHSDQPETMQTLHALKGLALILHLAALCSSPTWWYRNIDTCCHLVVVFTSIFIFVLSRTLSSPVWQFFSSSLGDHWDPGPDPEVLSAGVRRRWTTHLRPKLLSVGCPHNCCDPGLYPLPDKYGYILSQKTQFLFVELFIYFFSILLFMTKTPSPV